MLLASTPGVVELLILVPFYFAPSIVAAIRGHHDIRSIVAINLFLGWTAVGWIVAAWMSMSAVRSHA